MQFNLEILEDLLISLHSHYRGCIEETDKKRTLDRIDALTNVLVYLQSEGEFN